MGKNYRCLDLIVEALQKYVFVSVEMSFFSRATQSILSSGTSQKNQKTTQYKLTVSRFHILQITILCVRIVLLSSFMPGNKVVSVML